MFFWWIGDTIFRILLVAAEKNRQKILQHRENNYENPHLPRRKSKLELIKNDIIENK